MSVIINGNEVVLNGCVGDPSGWGWDDCFTASDVVLALAQVGNANDVVIRLNSGGGIATEGSAIHSAIARHKGKKTIIVEGIAASAASTIAMAGDDVVMSLGSIMMIHDPSGFTVGTIVDHQAQITALTALGDAMATIYAAKSGQSADDCRADMKAELWMTADQAVEKGYADRIEGSANDNEPIEPAAFNYTLYANAPQTMVALTGARHWAKPPLQKMGLTTPPAVEAEAANPNEEMSDMPTEQEIQARIDAALAEAKLRADAETETKVKAATAAVMTRSQAAEIAKLCNDGGVATMTASLLSEGVTVEQAKDRVDQAGQIKEMVALARQANPKIPEATVDEFLAAGKTVDQAKVALFDKLATASEAAPLRTTHTAALPDANAKAEATAKSRANMKSQLKNQGLVPKEG